MLLSALPSFALIALSVCLCLVGSANDSGILIDSVSTDKYEASLHKDARFWESIATRKTRGKKRRSRKFVSAQQEQFSISDDTGTNGKGSDSPNTSEISFLSTQAALLQQQQQKGKPWYTSSHTLVTYVYMYICVAIFFYNYTLVYVHLLCCLCNDAYKVSSFQWKQRAPYPVSRIWSSSSSWRRPRTPRQRRRMFLLHHPQQRQNNNDNNNNMSTIQSQWCRKGSWSCRHWRSWRRSWVWET